MVGRLDEGRRRPIGALEKVIGDHCRVILISRRCGIRNRIGSDHDHQ
jgi:hypothetical protein